MKQIAYWIDYFHPSDDIERYKFEDVMLFHTFYFKIDDDIICHIYGQRNGSIRGSSFDEEELTMGSNYHKRKKRSMISVNITDEARDIILKEVI